MVEEDVIMRRLREMDAEPESPDDAGGVDDGTTIITIDSDEDE
jgi:hypothetical protein